MTTLPKYVFDKVKHVQHKFVSSYDDSIVWGFKWQDDENVDENVFVIYFNFIDGSLEYNKHDMRHINYFAKWLDKYNNARTVIAHAEFAYIVCRHVVVKHVPVRAVEGDERHALLKFAVRFLHLAYCLKGLVDAHQCLLADNLHAATLVYHQKIEYSFHNSCFFSCLYYVIFVLCMPVCGVLYTL